MQIYLTKEAEKQFKKLAPSEKKKIKRKLMFLGVNSSIGKPLLGKYAKLRSLRAWPYRIVYRIYPTKKEIWIISILHRKDVYRKK